MANEKKIKAEELSDEQLNEATGGSAPTAGDPSKKSRKCANPNCDTMLPYDYPDKYCSKCKSAGLGNLSSHVGFQIVPGDQFNRR